MGMWSRLTDGLSNVVTGLGTGRDARTARAYSATLMDQHTVDAAYRGSGMLRKVIDIPALDTVREWRDWQAEAAEITALEAEERRLGLRAKVRQAEILRGLGGGALVLGVPGTPALPVNVRAISKGGLAFVHVVSRWQLTLGDMVDDPTDPLFGGPKDFRMTTGGGEVRIHPSRVICFKGDPLPSIIRATGDDVFWGEGRIARVLDACLNLDEALGSFSAIIKNARTARIGIPKMLEMVATSTGEQNLMKRLSLMEQGSSIINAKIYDAGDADGKGGEKLDYDQVTWTGIPEIIRTFAEALSAAADIPMTRLWGKAAEGMNSSGQSQQQDWNKLVRARQELDTRPCLEALDPMLLASAGVSETDVWWSWAPLDTPTEKEQADTFKTTVEAMKGVQDTGAIPDVAFAKAVQNTLVERGYLAGLDGALAEIPEGERFGVDPEPDETDPSALQEGGDPSLTRGGAVEAPRRRAANDRRFTDAAPRTLYVQRKLLNAADLIKWAKAQGFDTTASADELHVTIAYSRVPVDWMKIGQDWSSDREGKLTVNAGGPRLVEPLGDKGAVVLLFSSSDLKWRHEAMKEAGASFDFDEYQPHVTITYAKPDGLDLAAVEPYAGPLVFGPELFSELDEGWRPSEV